MRLVRYKRIECADLGNLVWSSWAMTDWLA